MLLLFVQMGEYEYHANPLDWHKASNKDKSKKGGESGVFRPPTVGRVGSLFNKIEVSCCCMDCCGWCLQLITKQVGCSHLKACMNGIWLQ